MERAELINRSNYWGILSFEDVEQILQYIKRLNFWPSTGWFLWETHDAAIALTQLRCVSRHGYYISKMKALSSSGFYISRFQIGDPDTYTVYIVKSPFDDRYYEYRDLRLIYQGDKSVSTTYKESYSSTTLNAAIDRILLRYSMYDHLSYWSGKAHACNPFSRFISVVCDSQNPRPHIPKCWSLQQLCLFFIRNYKGLYNYERRLPQLLVDMIFGMSAVKLCNVKCDA
jgi:hypothetical protein